jgi:hypothetical protein
MVMNRGSLLQRLLTTRPALAEHFIDPPSPTPSDLEYWTPEVGVARAQRQRNRRIAAWACYATVAIIAVIISYRLVSVFGVMPVVVGYHVCAVVSAAVLLAVPRWRRWLLSKSGSDFLLFFAFIGVVYIGGFWPKALGGFSVGIFIILAWGVAILIGVTIAFVSEWRTNRRLAIEQLTMGVIVCSTMIAGDHYVSRHWGFLLAIVPLLGWFAYLRLSRRRAHPREPN